MPKLEISQAEARRFLIHYHGLGDVGAFSGEKGAVEYLQRVGSIQYDPLDVVGRNADLVLQSRIADYRRNSTLEKLLYADRLLIDGWDKMMSIYRQSDWPYLGRVRKRRGEEVMLVLRRRDSAGALELTEEVKQMLRQQGPLRANEIKLGEAGRGRWGHRNLAGAALDYLFNIGEVGIRGKRGSQKVYDLIEHLLPQELLNSPDPFADERDFQRWYVERRVGGVGLLWGRNGGGWLGQYLSDKPARTAILAELVEEGRLIAVSIAGIEEVFYLRGQDLAFLDAGDPLPGEAARLLAPLDNLLRDRELVERIFGFSYSWEVYLPTAKRKYGYYVLPVLHGDRLIARVELGQQRGSAPLCVRHWWWEAEAQPDSQLRAAVLAGLQRFAQFMGAEFLESQLSQSI